MPAVTRAPAWTRGRVDPVLAVGVRLLLRQCCLKEFPDPAGFNSRRRVAVNWESRQPCCRSDHVLQRVIIMTRGYWHVLRQVCCAWLNRCSCFRCPRPVWRGLVTSSCSWCVEEILRLINRWEMRSVPSSHDFLGSILIQPNPVGLCFQFSPLCSHPSIFLSPGPL